MGTFILCSCVCEALQQVSWGHRKPPQKDHWSLDRRTFGGSMPLLSALWWLRTPCPAFARGMVRFPPDKPLSNKYYLVRPGESISDAEDLVVSNPVTKLDTVENGLTQRGRAQAESAASVLQSMNCEAPIIWYSTWGKSMQTAQILADQLGIQGDQRLPEYSYLDARGLGEFEGTPLAAAIRDMHKLDSASSLAQPPPTVRTALKVFFSSSSSSSSPCLRGTSL